MFTEIPALVNEDAALRHRGRFITTTFLADSGTEQHLLSVDRGLLTVVRGPFVSPRWQFVLRAAPDAWERFWTPIPPPGWHDLMAMIRFQTLIAEGDLHPFMSNLLWFKDVLASPRRLHSTQEVAR